MTPLRVPSRSDHRFRHWVTGGIAAAVATSALVVGSEFGGFHVGGLHPKVVAWCAAVVIVIAGIVAVQNLATALSEFVMARSAPAAGSAVRLLGTGIGYLIVVFATFAVLGVSIAKLLLGVGLASVVIGIAAQQSLGNIFAALVLLFAHPFTVGDYIRVRSSMIGVIDVWVLEIGLTYVTVRTDDGILRIPNSAMLAAGIGQLTKPTED